MRKFSLKMKLAVGFGSLLLVLVVVGGASYVSLVRLSVLSAEQAEKSASVMLQRDMGKRINAQQAELASYLLDGTRQQELTAFANDGRGLEEDFANLAPLVHTPKGKQILADMHSSWEDYQKGMGAVLQMARAGNNAQARALIFAPQTVAARSTFQAQLDALTARAGTLTAEARQSEQRAETTAKVELAGLIVLGLVLGFIITNLIARSIVGRISRMVAMFEAIAANDLSMDDMVVRDRDEIGKAGRLVNAMKNNLRTTVDSVATSAELVASAAVELAASSQQLLDNSDAQKGQSHQFASTMQEMSAAIAEVSANASRAATGAQEARQEAHRGGEVVRQTVSAMNDLAETSRATSEQIESLARSSTEVGKVVSVISEIAEQTNLLALNAAIEAARAGEQGRGFAVVAGEVRRLAERTSQATREIGSLIGSIQAEASKAVESITAEIVHVNESASSAARAGTALTGIIQRSENVREMIDQIATASHEQSAATEDVNRTLAEIARLVDLTTAGTQDSARASSELSRLAVELQQLVSRFRLGQQKQGARRPPAAEIAAPLERRAA